MIKEWGEKVGKKKITLFFPRKLSRRKELLEMGYLNLNKEIEKYNNQKEVLEEGIKTLYEVLELKKIPRVIECFDISNISGKDAVGAMSVAVEGRLSKKYYRKFKIKTKDTPDDFQMMREVVERRYSKLNISELPDLILIDGGLGQLGVVTKTLEKIGKLKFVDVISIAKREEEIFKSGESIPYIFPKNIESLKILQRLRDEAHRFGVTYHWKLRKKRVIKSELDDILGIGEKRKKELLNKFKSVKRIKEATLEELRAILPEQIAIRLKKELGKAKGD
jgi:excinuclease ABC subunit C